MRLVVPSHLFEWNKEAGSVTISVKIDEAVLDALFARIDQDRNPGVAVAVALDGTPVYRRGFGLASAELPVALSTSMRMRIGSITKHFVCLAYLLFCEEGIASLDDAIGRYVPGLLDRVANRTIRELMGHTSGIRDIIALTMHLHGTGRNISDAEMIDYYRVIDTVNDLPGMRWDYNNGGYILLTAAIEAIAGTPLAVVLRDRIFQPVQMYDTLLRPWDNDFVSNSASLHMKDSLGRWTREYLGMEVSGMGGMVSTMDDMLRWLRHMEQPVVGTSETWRTLKAPHRLADGTSTGYGLGLFSGDYRGTKILYHSGSVMGGSAQMIKVPAAGLDISIGSNRSDVSATALANQIIDLSVNGLAPSGRRPSSEVRTAVYVSKQTGRVVELSNAGGHQVMSVDGAGLVEVDEDRQGLLRPPEYLSFLQQGLKVESGHALFSSFGETDALTPVTIGIAADHDIEAVVGGYRCSAMKIDLDVTYDGATVFMTSTGRYGSARYRLKLLAPRIWRAESLGVFSAIGAIITISEDGDALTFNAARIHDLRFQRRL